MVPNLLSATEPGPKAEHYYHEGLRTCRRDGSPHHIELRREDRCGERGDSDRCCCSLDEPG